MKTSAVRHAAQKSWEEKFEVAVKGLPKVVEVPKSRQKQMGGKNILVPTPKFVDGVIRKIHWYCIADFEKSIVK